MVLLLCVQLRLRTVLPYQKEGYALTRRHWSVAMERLDIVVFGASGFTGGFVVTELAKVAAAEKLTWGVAGRDAVKLKQALRVAEDETGLKLDGTRIIVADVSSAASLLSMCQQAKVLLNCVGPYRLYGEPVVKACIAACTHHLDISGEPEYLEKMEYLYDTSAMTAGIYIVGACGFDSIPADMGVLFTRDSFDGELHSVEGFLNVYSSQERVVINYGTYESAVYSLANWNSLTRLRRTMARLRPAPAVTPTSKPPRRGKIFTVPGLSGCYSPEFGADGSIVHRTQRFIAEHGNTAQIQTRFYFGWRSAGIALLVALFGAVFVLLTKFALGRRLLLAYPGFFSGGLVSRQGPSRKHIAASSFAITFLGKGSRQPATSSAAASKDSTSIDMSTADIITKVQGPELGYVTTVKCLVQAGLTVLKEKDRLPKRGGVFTPGAIFAKTTLIDRLTASGVIFKVLKNKQN